MIIRCPECDTKFRLSDEKMKPSGIRVRCSHCNFVFRAGPPLPGEKYARVLRGKSKNEASKAQDEQVSQEHLAQPEAKTEHGENTPLVNTPSIDFPTIPPSLPLSMPPPLPQTPPSTTDDLFADLPPPPNHQLNPASSPESSPEIVPAGSGLDDLFSGLGQSEVSSPGIELAEPDPNDGEAPVFSDSLFINVDPDAAKSENTSAGLDFDDSPSTGSSPPLVNDISMPAAPPAVEPPAPKDDPSSSDAQALGKISLNRISTHPDGTPVASRPRTLTRPRTITAEYIDDIPEPGKYLRAFATFSLVLISLLGAIYLLRSSEGRAFNVWSAQAIREDLKQFKIQVGYQTKPSAFQINKLVAETYRLGTTEREVLLVQGTVTNTATTAFDSAVALVDIVHDGASIRTTMSPIGVSLDEKALAKVKTKSDLVQLKQQAKIDARSKGNTRFFPGKRKDFVFIMWDMPPELEQSAIYVAFRAGRGTVRL